jgi:hypothetical protein
MASLLSFAAQVVSLLNGMFDLLPKADARTDKLVAERAERFFFLTTRIEMSLDELVLHICDHRTEIIDFWSAVKNGKKDDISATLKDLLNSFPLPEILKLPEDDVYSLLLNRFIKQTRDEIKKMNIIAEKLKTNPKDTALLSQFCVDTSVLAVDCLQSEYERLLRFKVETTHKILGRKTTDVERKTLSENIENFKKMCEAQQRLSFENHKKVSEIEQKLRET